MKNRRLLLRIAASNARGVARAALRAAQRAKLALSSGNKAAIEKQRNGGGNNHGWRVCARRQPRASAWRVKWRIIARRRKIMGGSVAAWRKAMA
jgi:hypothetical protein